MLMYLIISHDLYDMCEYLMYTGIYSRNREMNLNSVELAEVPEQCFFSEGGVFSLF